MLIQLMLLPFVLVGLGLFALFISNLNERFPPLVPRPWLRPVGYVCVCAGPGALILSLGPALLLDKVFGAHRLAGFVFFAGYALGGGGGAALGLWRAVGRVRPE